MKENYQIYLPYQFHWRPHSVDWDAQLSHKKMKTTFLSNMSKSRRLTSTFFEFSPIRSNVSLIAYFPVYHRFWSSVLFSDHTSVLELVRNASPGLILDHATNSSSFSPQTWSENVCLAVAPWPSHSAAASKRIVCWVVDFQHLQVDRKWTSEMMKTVFEAGGPKWSEPKDGSNSL